MKKRIKKEKEIFLYYWTYIALVFFIILNYFSPHLKIASLNIGLIISVVTFLFGFLINISFSIVKNKAVDLREALAIETGRLSSIFWLSKNLGKNFYEKIREHIDKYAIKTLTYFREYEVGRQEISEIYGDLDLITLKSKHQDKYTGSLLYILGELTPIREKIEYLTKVRLLKVLKIVNYLLGSILIILLFLNRGDTFTNIIFIVLSTIIIFILLIIEDYDDLKIGRHTMNISNSEELFDFIGKPRYYPIWLLENVKIKRGETYRIGYIDSKTKKLKIEKVKW